MFHGPRNTLGKRRRLRVIVGIHADVFVSQVARPEAAAGGTFGERHFDVRFTIVFDRTRNLGGVESDRRALSVERQAVDAQIEPRGIEGNAGVTGRRNDTAPVRIASMHGAFEKWGVDDLLGHLS